MKMYKTVSDFIDREYSLRIGESYNTMEPMVFEFKIEDVTFIIHPKVDSNSNNEIVLISIRLLTDDKQLFVNSLKKLKDYFNLYNIPDIGINTNFMISKTKTLDYNQETQETLELILWDKVSSLQGRYEIELNIKKDKYVA